jgi:hypothetical protein
MNVLRVFVVVLFLGVAWCPCAGQWYLEPEVSQTIHLSPEGDDSLGDGSQEKPYKTLGFAAGQAGPGTRIFLHEGTYQPDQRIQNLQGTAEAPIVIRGVDTQSVIFDGGSSAFQISDPEYVILEKLTVQNASANGINIDDGGTYETPAHHLVLRDVRVRDIGPTGNRDGIKLSGVDHFRVERCFITNPGDSGSAIDMVGCHDGILRENRIEDCQGNGIQAKGGSARITMYANRFVNAGHRSINMGGSTGMQFFRPLDAPYEAADSLIWANVFVGSMAPVAFVGSEHCVFAHNTV